MSRPLLPRLIGVGLLCMATVFMFGWFTHERAILTSTSGFLVVFNTALCFALAALALIADGCRERLRAQIQTALGGALILLPGIVLSEHVFALELGIDNRNLHLWVFDTNPHPGRMAILTCIVFLLFGAVLILRHRVTSVVRAHAVRVLTAAIGVIGVMAVAGHILELRQMFNSYLFSQIALPAALGFTALSVALWAAWRIEPWNTVRLFKSDVARIVLASGVIMAAIALISGLAGFVVMRQYDESSLSNGLTSILANRVASLTQMIDRRIDNASRVAERTGLVERVAAVGAARTGAGDRLLREYAEDMLKSGYSSLSFTDTRGMVLMRAGQQLSHPELVMPLRRPHAAAILWSDRFFLHTEIAFSYRGRALGTLILQQPMPELSKLMSELREIGDTGELLFCSVKEATVACAPSRLRTQPFFTKLTAGNERTPGRLAAKGESGVIKYVDIRGIQAIGAYAPAGDLGLSAVVRVNTAALYAPIREQLTLLIPVVLVLIAVGIVLLRARILPLAAKLAVNEQRLQLALDGSRLALWDWNVDNGEVYLSEQWQTILGNEAKATATTIDELRSMVHPDDLPNLQTHLLEVIKGARTAYDVEHRVRIGKDGWKWIHSKGKVVARSADGRVARVTGTNADIDQHKQAELLVAHQAKHDMLTGLPNRVMFHDRLRRATARSKRHQRLMAVLYLDIDRFKTINDTLGHAMGDLLLKAFARRLTESVRQVDTVARLGGDEFVIILEELRDREAGIAIASKIVTAMQPEFTLEYKSLNITTSVGVAFYEGDETVSGDALIKRADSALYDAKSAGRNNYQVAA